MWVRRKREREREREREKEREREREREKEKSPLSKLLGQFLEGLVSLTCNNPSETKTTRTKISAAASSYKPI